MQDVSFSGIPDLLGYLPPEELALVERLRSLLFECLPDARERLAYNVPFYYRHARICFIWPGSVPWGKVRKEGVEFGLCRGHLIEDEGYMNRGGRKEVTIKTFHNLREIDAPRLRALLFEAAAVDEALRRGKGK